MTRASGLSGSRVPAGELQGLGPSLGRRPPAASYEHSPSIVLRLLGGFGLRLDERAVLVSKTGRRLLVFLAFSQRPVARTYVSQSLWLDATEKHADGNLRSALWRVGQLGACAIHVSNGELALGHSVTVDYQESVGLAQRLLHDPGSLDEEELHEEVFTQDLLPDWYEEWVVAERERYRQVRLHALEDLCSELVSRGRYARAVHAGLAAVSGEPLRESANLALIRAYLAEGNACEAIRHYESFRRVLWKELRVAPSPAMRQLVRAHTR